MRKNLSLFVVFSIIVVGLSAKNTIANEIETQDKVICRNYSARLDGFLLKPSFGSENISRLTVWFNSFAGTWRKIIWDIVPQRGELVDLLNRIDSIETVLLPGYELNQKVFMTRIEAVQPTLFRGLRYITPGIDEFPVSVSDLPWLPIYPSALENEKGQTFNETATYDFEGEQYFLRVSFFRSCENDNAGKNLEHIFECQNYSIKPHQLLIKVPWSKKHSLNLTLTLDGWSSDRIKVKAIRNEFVALEAEIENFDFFRNKLILDRFLKASVALSEYDPFMGQRFLAEPSYGQDEFVVDMGKLNWNEIHAVSYLNDEGQLLNQKADIDFEGENFVLKTELFRYCGKTETMTNPLTQPR